MCASRLREPRGVRAGRDDHRGPRRRRARPAGGALRDDDPTRRRLAERAQRAGVALRPRIEVQHATTALGLVAAGLAAG
jgi:hypothetical protein